MIIFLDLSDISRAGFLQAKGVGKYLEHFKSLEEDQGEKRRH